jgi:hypothetical protein
MQILVEEDRARRSLPEMSPLRSCINFVIVAALISATSRKNRLSLEVTSYAQQKQLHLGDVCPADRGARSSAPPLCILTRVYNCLLRYGEFPLPVP